MEKLDVIMSGINILGGWGGWGGLLFLITRPKTSGEAAFHTQIKKGGFPLLLVFFPPSLFLHNREGTFLKWK